MNRLVAAVAALTLLGCQDPASGLPDEPDPTPEPTAEPTPEPTPEPGEITLPFRVQDRRLAVYDPDTDTYEPLFIKGSNLGVGVPGRLPGELKLFEEDYDAWFQLMSDMGANTVRIYTLHYPRFYERLNAWNVAHPDNPLYVMHGVWLGEENPEGNLDLLAHTANFDAAIEEVIDAAHGDKIIDVRFGQAYGEYTVDASRWVIAWCIGREIDPHEVRETNELHPELTGFSGEYVELPSASPTEAWLTERLDHVVGWEQERWGVARPVGVSSWPTLDGLEHWTESQWSSEDMEQVDLSGLGAVDAPGGFFAVYHAYPYYPDFISEDPDYQAYEDEWGPNSYLGYLHDLADHYGDMPMIVGEFGVPTSWGNAHFSHSGMDHGGMDEEAQAWAARRMMQNIHEAGAAGGLWFAWMDEWWKRTWIVDDVDFPADRRRLWWSHVAPEQNFGLIAFEPPAPVFTVEQEVTGDGRIEALRGAASNSYWHTEVDLESPLRGDDVLTVAFDTYRDDLGESVLPDGSAPGARFEFALEISANGDSWLKVTEVYDVFGMWHGLAEDHQLFHSTASDADPWVNVRWINNGVHGSDDGELSFDIAIQDVGLLRTRYVTESPTSFDAVVLHDDRVEIQIPWTLLSVVSPAELIVLHDDRDTPGRDLEPTAGIRMAASLDGETLQGDRWGWQGWTEPPPTVERIKPVFDSLAQTYSELD